MFVCHFPGGLADSEKSDVGKRAKDQLFATIALKKGTGSKNEVSCVTHIYHCYNILGSLNIIVKFNGNLCKI